MAVSSEDIQRLKDRVDKNSFDVEVDASELPQPISPGQDLRVLESNGKGLKVVLVPPTTE